MSIDKYDSPGVVLLVLHAGHLQLCHHVCLKMVQLTLQCLAD